MPHTGQCYCGDTRLSIEGDPKFAIACYCTDCQRATGQGHAVQVGFDAGGLSTDGALKTHLGKANSGNTLTFGFCGTCGSPMTKSTSRAPGLTFVYAGVLDDPGIVPEVKDFRLMPEASFSGM